MCKKARAIECTIQMESQLRIVHSIAIVFLHMGSENCFGETELFANVIRVEWLIQIISNQIRKKYHNANYRYE